MKLTDLNGLKSDIVYNETLTPHEKICHLIEKYVLRTAQFQLNLSYQRREKLILLYNDKERLKQMNGNEFMSVFSGVIEDIVRLMGDSHQRFKCTSQYSQIVQNIDF